MLVTSSFVARALGSATLLAMWLVASVTVAAPPDTLVFRHDWRQTFKYPFFINDTVPGFEYFGNALPSTRFFRLSPSLADMKGAIWARESNPHKDWVVEFSINVFGRDQHGGDGIAFWYTKDRGQLGPVYGSKDQWEGAMLAFDTYDKKDTRNNPFVLLMVNDGQFELSKAEHPMSHILSGCYRDFRNSHQPVFTRVTYVNQTIKIEIDNLHRGTAYLPCLEAHDVSLPTGYYFGLSASSGHQAADDHEVISFNTYEILPESERSSHVEEPSKSDMKHMEEAEKVVHEALHKNEPDDPLDDHVVRAIQETQFRIIEKLDVLVQKTEDTASVAETGTQKNQLHANSLASEVKSLQESIHTLTADLRQLTGEDGLHHEIRRLHDTLTHLQRKIDEIDARSSALHHETRSSIHAVTTESSSSTIQYVFFFVAVQVVIYIAWNIIRQRSRESQSQRKFI